MDEAGSLPRNLFKGAIALRLAMDAVHCGLDLLWKRAGIRVILAGIVWH
jgi:hypothetical protein